MQIRATEIWLRTLTISLTTKPALKALLHSLRQYWYKVIPTLSPDFVEPNEEGIYPPSRFLVLTSEDSLKVLDATDTLVLIVEILPKTGEETFIKAYSLVEHTGPEPLPLRIIISGNTLQTHSYLALSNWDGTDHLEFELYAHEQQVEAATSWLGNVVNSQLVEVLLDLMHE